MGCVGSKEKKGGNKDTVQSNEGEDKRDEKPTNSNGNQPPHEEMRGERGGGKIEDNYDVGDELGRGAFSVVKRCRHKRSGVDYAIKFIEKKHVDKQDLMLLGREIEIMKKVDHQNVLKLQEVYETMDVIALVMELVNGGELFYKIVEKGNYSEKDAIKIAFDRW